jgi:tetratricopeptide (TPR) repeat protein
MLESVDPSEARGRDVSVRDALDAAAARIDGGAMAKQPAVEVAVRNAIGATYASLGLFDAAERQLRASIVLLPGAGASPLVRAETHARLVGVMYQQGKYADAEAAAREALRLRREVLGATHADVATSLDDLGAILVASGHPDQAEPLMREALAIRRQRLPADDPMLAVGLNNLAYVLWRKRNLQDAEAMFREALDIDRRRLGNDHPEVATRLLNLAVVLRDQGRADAAEPLAREMVAIRRKVLGDRHPDLANGMDTLAGVLEDRGRNVEAEQLLREALDIARKTNGETHIDTARLTHNLGWMLWRRGAYAEAEPLLRAAVVTIPKAYGPTYRGARLAMSNLAHNQNGLGDFRAAEVTAREAIAAYRKAPSDVMVVTALIALSHSLVAQRRGEEAIPHLREALDVTEKNPQARFPWFKGEVQSTLGAALAAQRQSTEAETLLLAGYEALRDLPATPPPRLRAALERLVAFYVATGRSAEAVPWRNRLQGLDAAASAGEKTWRR